MLAASAISVCDPRARDQFRFRLLRPLCDSDEKIKLREKEREGEREVGANFAVPLTMVPTVRAYQ